MPADTTAVRQNQKCVCSCVPTPPPPPPPLPPLPKTNILLLTVLTQIHLSNKKHYPPPQKKSHLLPPQRLRTGNMTYNGTEDVTHNDSLSLSETPAHRLAGGHQQRRMEKSRTGLNCQIKRRKWGWLGWTTRTHPSSTVPHALRWECQKEVRERKTPKCMENIHKSWRAAGGFYLFCIRNPGNHLTPTLPLVCL